MKKVFYAFMLLVVLVSCKNDNNTQKEQPLVEQQTQKEDIRYATYRNQKYSYKVAYPDFLLPQGEADSGDGQKFIDKSGAKQFWVYRCFKMDMETFEIPTLKAAFAEDMKDKEVVESNLQNNAYTIKSEDKGIVNIQYTLLVGEAYYEMLFIYPKVQEAEFQPEVKKIMTSFDKF